MKKISYVSVASVAAFFVPLVVGAQRLTNINDVASKATNIGNLIIELAISIAVLWIIINVVRYLIATNDPDKRKEGGQGILYGVIGLFVILSIWGLVAILRNSFQTDTQRPSFQDIKIPGPDSIGGGGNSDLQRNLMPGAI